MVHSSHPSHSASLHEIGDDPLAALSLSALTPDDGGPARLLHYILLTELGSGGMGVVFSAYDEKLDRKVAIKVLRLNLGQEGSRRLLREGQAMARISHPNVASIFEIGEHRGLTFIVMELIVGPTFRRWVREQGPSRGTIVSTLIGAGRGLAAAHERGVVHRDFKPENVLINGAGQAKVVDFGLAREGGEVSETPVSLTSSASELSSNLTVAGSLLGTPAYMAPEQFKGRPVDGQTDQFAFCVVLWEALFQERPFPTDDFENLAYAVSHGQIREPRRRDVPMWMRAALERGMSPRPIDRWPSLNALLDALGQERARKRRRRTALALTSVLALAAAGIAAGSLAATHERAEAEAACVSAGEQIRAQWSSSDQVALGEGFAATGLEIAASAWDHSQATLDAYATSWETARSGSCREAEVLRVLDPRTYAAVRACLDERRAGFEALVSAWAAADDAIVLVAPLAAARLEPVGPCLDPDRSELRAIPPDALSDEVHAQRRQLERVTALRRAHRLDDAREEAVDLVTRAEALAWRPLIAEARLALGVTQSRLGFTDLASETLVQATFEAIGSANDLVALDAIIELVRVLGVDMKIAARASYWAHFAERYIERFELEGSPRQANLFSNQGAALTASSAAAEALDYHRKALAIREAALGPDDPLTAESLTALGEAQLETGETRAAVQSLTRAADIEARVLGPSHPDVVAAKDRLRAISGR